MAKKLFVGSLAWGTTEDKLAQLFSQVGTVVSSVIITDKNTGRSKGFGFVEMASDEEAEKAKQQLNGQSLDGRNIAVSDARPQQPRENYQRNFNRNDNRNRQIRGRGNRR